MEDQATSPRLLADRYELLVSHRDRRFGNCLARHRSTPEPTRCDQNPAASICTGCNVPTTHGARGPSHRLTSLRQCGRRLRRWTAQSRLLHRDGTGRGHIARELLDYAGQLPTARVLGIANDVLSALGLRPRKRPHSSRHQTCQYSARAPRANEGYRFWNLALNDADHRHHGRRAV